MGYFTRRWGLRRAAIMLYREDVIWIHDLWHGVHHQLSLSCFTNRCIRLNICHLYFYIFMVQMNRNAWSVFSALCKSSVTVNWYQVLANAPVCEWMKPDINVSGIIYFFTFGLTPAVVKMASWKFTESKKLPILLEVCHQ